MGRGGLGLGMRESEIRCWKVGNEPKLVNRIRLSTISHLQARTSMEAHVADMNDKSNRMTS